MAITEEVTKKSERYSEITPNNLLEKITAWSSEDHECTKEQAALYHALQTLLGAVNVSRNLGVDDSSHVLFWPQLKFMFRIYEHYRLKNIDFQESEYNDINNFIVRIFLTVSAANNSNHRFFQNPSLDPSIFNVPLKMSLFYAAFINNAKNFLLTLEGDNEHKYEFILSPSLFERIKVSEFFGALSTRVKEDVYTEDKLLFISVAEFELYNTDFLFPLMHEIAHFVGSSVRCRDVRYQMLVKFISNLIVESILRTTQSALELPDELLHTARNKMYSTVLYELVKYSDDTEKDKYWQFRSKLRDKFSLYVDTMIEFDFDKFVEPLKSVIWQYLKELPGKALYDLYKKSPHSEERTYKATMRIDAAHAIMTSINEDFHYIREKFIGISVEKIYAHDDITLKRDSGIFIENASIPVLRKCIHDFLSLSSEIYADIIAMLSINTDIDTYITQLMKNCESIFETLAFTRIKTIIMTFDMNENVAINGTDVYSDSKLQNAIERRFGVQPKPNNGSSVPEYWYLRTTLLDEVLVEYAEHCYKQYMSCIENNDAAAAQQQSLHDVYFKSRTAKNIVAAILANDDLLQNYVKSCDWETVP